MTSPLYSLARRLTRVALKNDAVWECAQRLPVLQDFFWHQRNPVIRKRAARQCQNLFADRKIQSGPFEGMRYAESAAVGSMLWPKFLGTYESELHPCLVDIQSRAGYRQIVDVGYAEGYYLIGLGRMFADAELVGFDTEEEAKQLCHANADVNSIAKDRLRLFGAFESETFRDTLQDDALVVVDCEGFENDVIGGCPASDLSKADWLIETHDHLVPGTTGRLRAALEDTHDVTEVVADDDLEPKLRLLPESVRRDHSEYVQEALVSECRKIRQSWLYARRAA